MIDNLKILVVESNRYHAVLLQKEIFKKYSNSSVDLVVTGALALTSLSDKKYGVAIVDFCDLADIEGLQLLELMRKEDIELPIIVIDNNESEQIASEVMKSGAAEYLVKDISFHHSVAREIAEVCRRQTLIMKNRAMEEMLNEKECTEAIRMATGTLSHEINNPLMTILGVSELLISAAGDGDKELIRKIRIIQKSARRIKNSLNRLEHLTHPVLKETPSGLILDAKNSGIGRKIRSRAKFSKNFS